MNNYLIPIDLKSIKKNPDAGSTVSYCNVGQEITFSCVKLPEWLIPEVNCFITDEETHIISSSFKETILYGVIFNFEPKRLEKLLEKGIPKEFKFNINIKNNIQRIDYFPEPDYFFDYENIEIQCSYCKEKFMSNELESDEILDVYSITVCPKCGEFDCVQIKYEGLEDALKRKKNEAKSTTISK